MNIQALDLKPEFASLPTVHRRCDRYIVQPLLDSKQNTIALKASKSVPNCKLASCSHPFYEALLLDGIAGFKSRSQTEQQLLPSQGHTHV